MVRLLHKAAEVIGRAAERHRQAARGQHRQQPAKERGIFEREERADPGRPCIGDDERRLEADEVVRRGGEAAPGFLDLARMRAVFGVVDDEIVAARRRERIGKRLRFRARVSGRDFDDLVFGAERQGRQRR